MFYKTVIAILLSVIKQNRTSDKATRTLVTIPPCNLESSINCMRNQIKPFFEKYTIKDSILRITFDAFNEWTILQPEPVCYIRSCP